MTLFYSSTYVHTGPFLSLIPSCPTSWPPMVRTVNHNRSCKAPQRERSVSTRKALYYSTCRHDEDQNRHAYFSWGTYPDCSPGKRAKPETIASSPASVRVWEHISTPTHSENNPGLVRRTCFRHLLLSLSLHDHLAKAPVLVGARVVAQPWFLVYPVPNPPPLGFSPPRSALPS